MKNNRKVVEDRQQRILNLVRNRGEVRNEELAEELGVSLMTVRRDLDLLEEQKLRHIVTENDREQVALAHKKATTRTLWERITKTNHKDVRDYKSLLKEYTRELLETARLDFMEEIAGKHISNKAFEE